MTQPWRLLLDEPMRGAANMARDRALQWAHESGDSPPTLRLYRWSAPTVTLGRFQASTSVDDGVCDEMGIDIVRRPTGGRGVLHDDELTYSLVAGVADGIPRGVSASYQVLCNGLVESFRRLGVPAGLTERDRGERSSACYLHASLADVSAGVRKLSGSAQVWRGDTVLQHGSFVRTRDIDRESRVFRLDERARERLASSTATLADLLPIVPDVEEMRRAVSLGVQDGLGVQLEEGELTGRERALEEEFLREAMKHGEIVRPLT